ncbi:hypothetical protein [Aureimonas sp. SA4125]|uniref:hypothetical protein n=1 Tax=Aureimonas sp. SA4125 TaxID=2826993 RepID=UPI001CC569AF|nr:hypothetical protein [Aureimonas sp. SA4125]
MITIHRGCARRRVRGVSWTLDRNVAEGFARGHRAIRNLHPVIASTRVPRAIVLAAFTERGEAEVLIDPRFLPVQIDVERCFRGETGRQGTNVSTCSVSGA